MSNKIFIGRILNQTLLDDEYPNHSIIVVEVAKMLTGAWPLATSSVVITPPKIALDHDDQFPRLVNSVIFPNLIYDMFQMVGTYDGRSQKIPPVVCRTLYFLENFSGFAEFDLFLQSCWPKKGSLSAGWNAISSANKYLESIGISRVITCENGEICTE